jgi:hypothetical protein
MSSHGLYDDLLLSIVKPNATHQARRRAGTQRTLYTVACLPW